MSRAKITDYQLTAIKQWITVAGDEAEMLLLEKYNIMSLEELYAGDYEAIVDFLSHYLSLTLK